MSKSIYEEAIEILSNMGTEFISVPCNPIGEENSDMIHLRDATETYETNIYEVVKALKQAQKQEKLLEIYIKIYNGITDYHDYDELSELQKEIKELENENKGGKRK